MPVFDFKNSPEEQKAPECTYEIFYSSNPEASADHPMLVLDNREGQLKHHSNGTFTNPIRKTAFEFKGGDRHGQCGYLEDRCPVCEPC